MSRSVGALRQNDFDSTSCENSKPYLHDPCHSGLPFETGGHATPRPINFSALSALALRRAALWNWGSYDTTTNNNPTKFFCIIIISTLVSAGLPIETGGHTTPRALTSLNFYTLSSLDLWRVALWNCGWHYTRSNNQLEWIFFYIISTWS